MNMKDIIKRDHNDGRKWGEIKFVRYSNKIRQTLMKKMMVQTLGL